MHGLSLKVWPGWEGEDVWERELAPPDKSKAEREDLEALCESLALAWAAPASPAVPPLNLGGRMNRAQHSVGSCGLPKARGWAQPLSS